MGRKSQRKWHNGIAVKVTALLISLPLFLSTTSVKWGFRHFRGTKHDGIGSILDETHHGKNKGYVTTLGYGPRVAWGN